jgi:hypothetical protein
MMRMMMSLRDKLQLITFQQLRLVLLVLVEKIVLEMKATSNQKSLASWTQRPMS